MMKRWLWFISCLILACACSREIVEPEPVREEGSTPEGARVRVNISIPGDEMPTKALGEIGELNTLHLAVFGGSGYLKEYAQATPTPSGTYTYQTTDKDGNPVSRTVPMYNFTVDLEMSDNPRTIHFLGNGPSTLPFGYDTSVMPVQLSPNGEMGYWQVKYLERGIRGKRNDNGEYIDINGNVIPDGGSGYIADAETELAFQGIPLIRNWAKIVLTAAEESNFTPISFAAVNTPSRGTMAPYSASTGFLYNYETMGFTYLEDEIAYPGNLPPGALFNSDVPAGSAFTAPFGDGVADADGGAVYLYERPAPSSSIPPSYVIIYGHYRNPEDLAHEGDYFYKVDLMETKKIGDEFVSRYYPIYRNFKYQIVVKKILAQGHATPQAAALSAGSADVSADVSTQHLADISDGIGRLHVMPWMSQAFTRAHSTGNPVDILRVWFGSPDGQVNMDPSVVTARILPMEDGGEDILYNLTLYPPDEETGWRRITFYNIAPGKTVRTQTIRITGLHEDGRLYRDIPITLEPIQPLSVRCEYERVPATKGTPQTVHIDIPDGLVESMFPLIFTVEADKMTLTPDNSYVDNNLPVIWGKTISETESLKGKRAFQFQRTLTWEDYLGLERFEDEDENMWRTFSCYFKTNCEESASDIWVYNEFFDKGHASFVHYNFKEFKNLGFTTTIPQEEGVTLPLSFDMVEDPGVVYPAGYPKVLLRPSGLRLEMGGNITAGPEPGTYYVKPEGHTVVLNFITTTSNPDEIEVGVQAEGYEDGYVKPYRFERIGFLSGYGPKTGGSNVAFGHVNHQKKRLLFGYYENEARLNVPITIESFTGLKVNAGTNGFPSPFPGVGRPWTPTGPYNAQGDPRYHELDLIPLNDNYVNVGLVISAPGYIQESFTVGRFNGDIRAVVDTKIYNNLAPGTLTATYEDKESGKVMAQYRISASEISSKGSDYIQFDPGKSYRLTITNLLPNRMDILYFRMDFTSSTYCPASVTADIGEVYKYGGSPSQYLWYPSGRGTEVVGITITPGSEPVRLKTVSYKAFEGDLYFDGVKL